MASPGNHHCANCIGTLSFPICRPQSSVCYVVCSVPAWLIKLRLARTLILHLATNHIVCAQKTVAAKPLTWCIDTVRSPNVGHLPPASDCHCTYSNPNANSNHGQP